ncbi:MAG: phage baseplate assembly protein domain-containing protein [Acidiphilium sp.]
MLDEVFGAIRGIASMGVVQAVQDGGTAQTVTVLAGDGVLRANVEVMQIFGFASLAPANGAICLLLAVGADPANLRALPIACPAARFGQLGGGESVQYASDGSRIHIKPDGSIAIWAAASVTVNAPAVTFNGPAVTIDGTLTVTEDVVIAGGSYITHTHSDPQGGETGPPEG